LTFEGSEAEAASGVTASGVTASGVTASGVTAVLVESPQPAIKNIVPIINKKALHLCIFFPAEFYFSNHNIPAHSNRKKAK
jgi:uncharacterized membrane protein